MMKCRYWFLSVIVASAAFLCHPVLGDPITPVLGNAQSFSVLAGSTVTNAGGLGTTITGDLGVWSSGGANAITGFDTDAGANTIIGNGTTGSVTNGGGIVNAPGTIYAGGATPQAAQSSLTAAIVALNGLPVTQNLAGAVLGNGVGGTVPTLVPGVYSFPSTTAEVSGKLTLDAGGQNGVYWVFQIGTALTADAASSVVLKNPGSNNGFDDGVFWVVGSSATLDSSAQFEGNILAYDSISLVTTASILNGRALAEVAAVNLDDNVISNICLGTNGEYIGPGFSSVGFNGQGELVGIPPPTGPTSNSIPEPSTLLLVGSGLVGLLASRKGLRGSRGKA